MAKPHEPREGERITSTGLTIPYSFWPAKHGKRWELQRRLYVKDPWATLSEAVYRSEAAESRRTQALSFLAQAEEYFNAGTQSGTRIDVKPVLLYYAVLNLVKSLLAVRVSSLDLSKAYHGLKAERTGKWALLGDKINVVTSANKVNVFPEAMQHLEGYRPQFKTIELRHLLPQILPAHRLWSYARGKREQFINVEIDAFHDSETREAWLTITMDRGDLAYMGKSVNQLIEDSGLPGTWKQVFAKDSTLIRIEQQAALSYAHRPLDCVQSLFSTVRPSLWSVVTSIYPHRKYYLHLGSQLGVHRLPQWASTYVLFYYLSDVTRYRPVHFDRFVESKYGPQMESIIDECPRQFLYLMASELLRREVAPAAIA